MQECIAAVSTANGTGGVAIIRVSGDRSLEIARKMFVSKMTEGAITPNYMYAGNIIGDGFTDYGFMVYFKAPKSFTGEDIVEFHCHGGTAVARGILKKALLLGARAAERGEFTRRAFLNGKLSLASAEGMIDMINAESLALIRAGSMLYSEKLTEKVKEKQSKLKDILARIDVEIDYPEEDNEGVDLLNIISDLKQLQFELSELLKTYSAGKKIKNGISVAIVGEPNTGKSSLLNALLGYDKAIVSSEAGTTRDAVEGEQEIDGVKYTFIDTAGIRETCGEVEGIGIDRAKKFMQSADIVLCVTDGKDYIPENISGKVIRVFNKCDIYKPQSQFDAVVSAKTGAGLENLKKLIASAGMGETSYEKAYIVEERHFSALKRAEQSIASALLNISSQTVDLIAVDLKDAWDALGEITGETASEEIVNTIFEKFCVGK